MLLTELYKGRGDLEDEVMDSFQKDLFSSISTVFGWKCTKSQIAPGACGAIEIHLSLTCTGGEGFHLKGKRLASKETRI